MNMYCSLPTQTVLINFELSDYLEYPNISGCLVAPIVRVLRTRRQFLTLKDPCSDTNKGTRKTEEGEEVESRGGTICQNQEL